MAPITDNERRYEIESTYRTLETVAVSILKETSPTKFWPERQIRGDPDRMHDGFDAALAHPEGQKALDLLVRYKACTSAQEARYAVLAELERMHPWPHFVAQHIAPVNPAFANFSWRIYHRYYHGNQALMAYIIAKKVNPYASDYTILLADMVMRAMNGTAPPTPRPGNKEEVAAKEVVDMNGPYVQAVVREWEDAAHKTSGRTDTQLGLRADHSTFRF
jgi:hypothetical protein